MKISTKGHYAVQALVDIASQPKDEPISLAVISERQGLSQNYLEQLFVKLRKAKLVNSVRGPGGGYHLARAPESIVIGEIFEAVDESLSLTDCADDNNLSVCDRMNSCATQNLWLKLRAHFNNLLHSITLKHVVNGELDISDLIGQEKPTTTNVA